MDSENITLPDGVFASSQGDIRLTDINHEFLVIYFYPKDSTPGCTTQANEFTALNDQFSALDTQIIGVSRDPLASHQRFIDKQAINFCLISDSDETLCRHFDVIKEKNMYGKKVMGIERSAFIFQRQKLVAAFRKVKAKGNAENVLQTVQQLKQA